jgi:OmpA-OmpF porin, OOP family
MKKYMSLTPLISLLLVSNSLKVQAADDTGGLYFSPMLSYIKSDNDRQADDDFGVMLGLGKQLNDKWNVEVSAAIDNLGAEAGSGEYKQRGLVIDGLYFFDRTAGMQTYGVIGAGFMKTDTGVSDTSNPLVNVGVGVMKNITEQGMKIRADIRYRLDMDDQSVATEDKFNDMMLNVGLVIPFGDEKKSQPAPVAAVVTNNTDSDKDGVTDASDFCPNTTAGVDVDDKGCEITKKVEVPVVSKPMDSDKDGIADNLDECADTVSGVRVDGKGCELQSSFVLKGVNFVTGSDVLTMESRNVLNDVAETLAKNSDIKVEIAGYTDNVGRADANQRLSLKRAESVKAYLVSAGVKSDKMTAKGYGDSNPIADNASTDGRAQNRRVELHVIK